MFVSFTVATMYGNVFKYSRLLIVKTLKNIPDDYLGMLCRNMPPKESHDFYFFDTVMFFSIKYTQSALIFYQVCM